MKAISTQGVVISAIPTPTRYSDAEMNTNETKRSENRNFMINRGIESKRKKSTYRFFFAAMKSVTIIPSETN